ncbi:hypothetical protein SAMN06298226_2620 [Nitrosovibrio sp. Nv4]|nr:hypothetical protein SAMN06298226_2620 [Nitrosovibrio sp. Nv4]
MALYQDQSFLIQSSQPLFDLKNAPGAIATASGIYRCNGCGCEIAVEKGYELPSHAKHDHGFQFGPATWQLIVAAI